MTEAYKQATNPPKRTPSMGEEDTPVLNIRATAYAPKPKKAEFPKERMPPKPAAIFQLWLIPTNSITMKANLNTYELRFT
jgi:hypothetical protein